MMPKLTMNPPALPGRPMSKADLVSAATSVPECQAPVTMSTSPVMVQTMMVSMKVPVMLTSACWQGSLVLAAAAAMGALPRPDSLEKTPRETPFWMASITVAPTKPPVAAVPVKASLKTRANAPGTSPAKRTRMARQPRT